MLKKIKQIICSHSEQLNPLSMPHTFQSIRNMYTHHELYAILDQVATRVSNNNLKYINAKMLETTFIIQI